MKIKNIDKSNTLWTDRTKTVSTQSFDLWHKTELNAPVKVPAETMMVDKTSTHTVADFRIRLYKQHSASSSINHFFNCYVKLISKLSCSLR